MFSIVARNASPENIYIESMTLNGKPFNGPVLRHSDIVAGGTLECVMTSKRPE